jgi:hypothetical protein
MWTLEIPPPKLELSLVFMIYMAALNGQRLQRNHLRVQTKSWQNDRDRTKEWLAKYKMTL